MEKQKIETEFSAEKFRVSMDLDQDGKKSFDLHVNNNELIQEILKRDDAKDGVKLVEFGLEDGQLVLKLDTDKDGENVLSLRINAFEAWDELKA